MAYEKLGNEGSGNQASEWDSLIVDYREFDPETQKKLRDELLNIEDMRASGRIDAEKARRYREEVLGRFNAISQSQPAQPAPETEPKSEPVKAARAAEEVRDGIIGQTFQVGPGLSLEAEFKRITG